MHPILLILMILTNISAAAPAMAPRGRVVVLGDSLTEGYGLTRAEAFPAVLQRKVDAAELPFKIINSGKSGNATSDGLRRLADALAGGADVLVIALGVNDGIRGVPPAQIAENLTSIIWQARAGHPALSVILCGMQMPLSHGEPYAMAFAAIFPQVAAESGTELVPFFLEGVAGIARLNQPDLIHPNPEGQERIAENVWPILRRTLERRLATGRP